MSREGTKQMIMLGMFLLWEQHCRAGITQCLLCEPCVQLPRELWGPKVARVESQK